MTTTMTEPRKTLLTTPSEREIRVERIFNASRDRVWRAYTDPKLVAQWWGRGNKLVVERMEVERGGHWRYVELVNTFEWDGMPGYVIIVTTEFQDLGDNRTKIIATSLFYATEERDGMLQSGMEGGMNESYAALDRLLTGGADT